MSDSNGSKSASTPSDEEKHIISLQGCPGNGRPENEKKLYKILNLQLAHSLDCIINTSKACDSQSKKLTARDPLDRLFHIENELYMKLPSIRYSACEERSETADQLFKNKLDSINTELKTTFYKIFGNQDNSALHGDTDDMETIFIQKYFSVLVDGLKAVHENTDEGSFTSEAITRFIKNRVRFSEEKSDSEANKRWFKNAISRNSGEDRGGYWDQELASLKKKSSEKAKIDEIKLLVNKSDNAIKSLFTEITNEESSQNFAVRILLLFSKYHMLLHQYAYGTFTFRKLEQHFANVGNKKEIERAQKIFTFLHHIIRYFPELFGEGTNNAARMIEITCYIQRAICYKALGENHKAFNDYSRAAKLTSIMRDSIIKKYKTNDIVSVIRDNKPKIDCIDRLAALYCMTIPAHIFALIGDLYRSDHAFYNAHHYYCISIGSFDKLNNTNTNNPQILRKIYANSLKIVRIKMSKGKTFLELGKFKKALKWYLEALKHLIEIFKHNKLGKAFKRRSALDEIIDYLESISYDPKINKSVLSGRLKKATKAVLGLFLTPDSSVKTSYGILLSDIFNRIAFVVLILNIPNDDDADNEWKQDALPLQDKEKIHAGLKRNDLASQWLELSFKFNPNNSMALFNSYLLSLDKRTDDLSPIKEYMKFPKEAELTDHGSPRNILYRTIARATLAKLIKLPTTTKQDNDDEKRKKIHADLLGKLLAYTEDFSMKSAELYKYLMKGNHGHILSPQKTVYFHVLQRWSSIYPALPRPSTFKMKGGGYFLVYNGKGMAIDPGINFIDNLYSEGYSIADVHYIVVTHDHIDHTADIDTIRSLHFKRFGKLDKKQLLTLIMNPSVSSRFGSVLHQGQDLYKKIEISPEVGEIEIEEGLTIRAIHVEHPDLSSPNNSHAIGLIISCKLKEDLNKKTQQFKIGITSDTKYDEKIISELMDVDILIAHINSATFKELIAGSGISLKKKYGMLAKLNKAEKKFSYMVDQIKYSLGYQAEKDSKNLKDPKKFKAFKELFKEKQPSGNDDHLLLSGVINAYECFSSQDNEKQDRLFIISEFSEEMGSYRNKVAEYLNAQYRDKDKRNNVTCMTADIGMLIRRSSTSKIEVQCSRCALRNDYSEDDRFHVAKNIKEVCLKHEDEGIFYFCRHHDPEGVDKRSIDDFGFVEFVARYQPFKHIG